MKYIIMLGDGMADHPLPELSGKTPLDVAMKPRMDFLAQNGACGLARTVPPGMPPGSDTANLSVMGYAPEKYYSGRSPLEAMSMGIDLKEEDVAYRCNLVTLSQEADYTGRSMADYCAGEISTEEARQLIQALEAELGGGGVHFYPGISYRHCLVHSPGDLGASLTPPHDISGQPIWEHLPKGGFGPALLELQQRSAAILANHPVNLARQAAGLNPANSAWFWGEGRRPRMPSFASLYGLQGGVVCAVDLIKGLGLCLGWKHIPVPTATGGMVTDYAAKGQAALALLNDGCDLVYIHVEAPDECGHHGDLPAKIRAIEAIDQELLAPLLDSLISQGEDYAVLLTPDHATPIPLKTHTSEPIPFVLYRSTGVAGPHAPAYNETDCGATGLFLAAGPLMMQKLVSGDF